MNVLSVGSFRKPNLQATFPFLQDLNVSCCVPEPLTLFCGVLDLCQGRAVYN